MIEKGTIKKFADLARITLSEEEEKTLYTEIDSILEYVSLIKEAGGEGGETELGDTYNVMREDESPHGGGIFTEELLAEAPRSEKGYVKVKRILEQ